MNNIIVCGAGGFIGGYLVKRLAEEGNKVLAVDIKPKEEWFQLTEGVLNYPDCDLRRPELIKDIIRSSKPNELYQLAADMGGAGYVFTNEHDADIMHNSATINLNVAHAIAHNWPTTKVFYSSSACIYPQENQLDPENPNCAEDTAYPANPDSEYGWEKLFSERMWKAFAKNYNLYVRIARFHNIFGPYGSWNDGKEKAPAAICRKVLEASLKEDKTIEVWGSGNQTRSFLYIDECIEGILRLMRSPCEKILNIGSDEMVSINGLVTIASRVENLHINIKNIDGPEGVQGRNSDNNLIFKELNWRPAKPLSEGIKLTYNWIKKEIEKNKSTTTI